MSSGTGSQSDFLVIGAMKSATTTLYHDLQQNPHIVCAEKEDGEFLSATRSPAFSPGPRPVSDSPKTVVRGEICTRYSMLPVISGVARRARESLGGQTRIIYLVRNPVTRTLSHHQHMFNWHGAGRMGPDINLEIRNRPELTDYSKYFMQLEPWVEQFGLQSILVLRFEDYIRARPATLSEICEFLGIPDVFAALNAAGANRGHDRLLAGPRLLRLYQNGFFRRCVKPLVPDSVRGVLRKLLLRKPENPAIAPTPETVDRIIESVSADGERLARLLGRDKPLWDLSEAKTALVSLAGTAPC